MTKLTSIRDIIESGFKPHTVKDALLLEEWLREVNYVVLDKENMCINDVDGSFICSMEKVC